MDERPLWHEAAALAARAHLHQVRKDGRTPYVAHPARVAVTVATVFGCTDELVLAAAFLHDVIEDADVDFDDVHELCGREVATLCAVLTKDMRLIEPEREQAYDAQLAAGPWQGRLLKLADVYDNLGDAATDGQKRTLLDKARRALDLARDDAELARARDAVRERMQAIERDLAGRS